MRKRACRPKEFGDVVDYIDFRKIVLQIKREFIPIFLRILRTKGRANLRGNLDGSKRFFAGYGLVLAWIACSDRKGGQLLCFGKVFGLFFLLGT
jgi:hypothetical protein